MDFTIDILSFFYRTSPKEIKSSEWDEITKKPEKKISIFVANWHEEQVLEAMVKGNLSVIQYKNYEILLGVYPNDKKTLSVARELEKQFTQVQVVVNSSEGPTSKGQMLNEITRYWTEVIHEKKDSDLLIVHDAEDMIAPRSLKLANHYADQYDFIQIPVFSETRKVMSLVASVYMDEFSYLHTHELPVRHKLKAGLPGAGVGMVLRRDMVETIVTSEKSLFKKDSLTEDYVLGLSVQRLGGKSYFPCRYFKKVNNETEFVATRELFPKRLLAAFRQRTRWITGIVFQGYSSVSWAGSFWRKFFLLRDRLTPLNHMVVLGGMVLLTYFVLNRWLFNVHYKVFTDTTILLFWINMVFLFWRFVIRVVSLTRIYPFKTVWMLPIRWFLANFINSAATFKAGLNLYQAHRAKAQLTWDKTEHEIPSHFGK